MSAINSENVTWPSALEGALGTVGLAWEFEVEVGGTETRGATGGVAYVGTETRRGFRPDSAVVDSQGRTVIEGELGGIRAALVYEHSVEGPTHQFSIEFRQPQPVVVRNLYASLTLTLPDADWRATIPGNGIDRAVPLSQFRSAVGVSPLGGLRGSAALVHLAAANAASAAAIWCWNDVDIPEISVVSANSSVTLRLTTNLASDLNVIDELRLELLALDLSVPMWGEFPEVFQRWLRHREIESPANPPSWSKEALIWEAQIGFSVFASVHQYGPYPEVQDLINDLDRIQKLGFSVIQLMPRQPYPSYNIHDFWDISTSYGDVDAVKRLVQECHARGMRVILDVLLHGVLDQESIGEAADGVRTGPYATRVTAETGDSFSTDVNDWDNYLIAWSRHILDFEPYWKAGSPAVSPLIARHPNWFFRNSQGHVTGVYTKAFDSSVPEWQDYFIEAMSFLVRELDIDGFRFDAPTYNDFPNWSPEKRARASASTLGCVELFDRLRPVLKELKSDLLMYTEPSGLLLRKAMDVNYNYDEQWLVTALTSKANVRLGAVTTGKGLARWMQDRDALLPAGSMTAHHIDSHDTFWWPSWGKKWRREQFPLSDVRLLALTFGMLPGPYMMFVGGEIGIEDLLSAMASLKDRAQSFESIRFETGEQVPEDVFWLVRKGDAESFSVLVNYGHDHAVVSAPHGTTEVLLSEAGIMSSEGGVWTIPPRSGFVVRTREVS